MHAGVGDVDGVDEDLGIQALFEQVYPISHLVPLEAHVPPHLLSITCPHGSRVGKHEGVQLTHVPLLYNPEQH